MEHEEQLALLNQQTLLLAYLCIREEKGLPRQVAVIDRFGLSNSQIAAVCGSAVQSIKNARLTKKTVASKK